MQLTTALRAQALAWATALALVVAALAAIHPVPAGAATQGEIDDAVAAARSGCEPSRDPARSTRPNRTPARFRASAATGRRPPSRPPASTAPTYAT